MDYSSVRVKKEHSVYGETQNSVEPRCHLMEAVTRMARETGLASPATANKSQLPESPQMDHTSSTTESGTQQ